MAAARRGGGRASRGELGSVRKAVVSGPPSRLSILAASKSNKRSWRAARRRRRRDPMLNPKP